MCPQNRFYRFENTIMEFSSLLRRGAMRPETFSWQTVDGHEQSSYAPQQFGVAVGIFMALFFVIVICSVFPARVMNIVEVLPCKLTFDADDVVSCRTKKTG